MITRRAFTVLAAAAPGMAQAQGLSTRPITLVVPFSAGSGPDLIARIFAEWLQRRWSQPVVVDNRIGASGNIGTAAVARAAPDGQTLLVTANTLGMNVSLFRTLPYDPVASFAPVAILVDSTFALIAPAGFAPDLAGFLARVKAQPGALNYASPGIGTPHHLAMELFLRQAGLDMLHIPYRGVAGAVADVVGAQVNAMVLPANQAVALTRDGRVRLLAVASATRSPLAPDAPTLVESGITGVDVDNWWGVLAPAGTPPEIVARFNAEANAMLADPAMASRLAGQGLVARGGTADAMRAQIAADVPRWAAVVRDARITPE